MSYRENGLFYFFYLFAENLTMVRLCWEKKSGSHLNVSPSGIRHFMNHADAVESGSAVHALINRQ